MRSAELPAERGSVYDAAWLRERINAEAETDVSGVLMNDTSPEIAALVRARLLKRSGAERVLMGSRMFDTARAIILASFPTELSEIEIKRRLCERLYGNEVDVEAFVQHLQRRPLTKPQSKEPLANPPCGSAGMVQSQPTNRAYVLARESPMRKLGDGSDPA